MSRDHSSMKAMKMVRLLIFKFFLADTSSKEDRAFTGGSYLMVNYGEQEPSVS